ncbi:hypothetical protein [Bradyrhizobium sp. SYSU BS000235]
MSERPKFQIQIWGIHVSAEGVVGIVGAVGTVLALLAFYRF